MRFRADDRERGVTALEFALVAPVALLFVGVLMWLGFYGVFAALAQNAARDAARFASIHVTHNLNSDYPDESAVQGKAIDVSPGFMPTPTVRIQTQDAEGGPDSGDIVTVTLTYRVGLLEAVDNLLFGLAPSPTIERTASARRE